MKRTLLTSGIVAVALVALASGPWPPDPMTRIVEFELAHADGAPRSSADLHRGRALVVAYGAPWCEYSRRQLAELAKLRDDFAAEDLALVQVVVGGSPGDMVAADAASDVLVVGDPDGAHARSIGLDGVPVVQVVDPDGGVVWEKNFTPRAWLRDRVKVALAALDRPLEAASVAGRAQTVCPVTGGPFDHSVFADLPVAAEPPAADAESVVQVHRVYLASPQARSELERNPRRYLEAMSALSVTPEQVWYVHRPSSDRKLELCRPCGSIKGSAEFLKFWSQPRASCLHCRRMLGSPGCCASDAELEAKGLCPKCGYPKDDPACCTLQGRELCPRCGLERTSKGCCHIV